MSDFRRARQGSSDVFFVHKFTHLFCYTGDRRNEVEKMLIYSDRQRGSRKIYHRQQCSFGRRIQKDHAGYLYTEEEALAQGYRPCKRCHPYQNSAVLGIPFHYYRLFCIHRHLQNYTTGSGVPVYKKNAAQRVLQEGPQKNDRYRKKNRKNHQKKLTKKAGLHQETKQVLYLLQQLKRGAERSPQE